MHDRMHNNDDTRSMLSPDLGMEKGIIPRTSHALEQPSSFVDTKA